MSSSSGTDAGRTAPDLNRTAPVLRFVDSRRIDRILEVLVERGGSDLHLSVGRPPLLRVGGELEPVRHRTVSAVDFEVMVGPIAPPDAWERFRLRGEVEFAYQLDEVGRFRVNLIQQERGPAAVLRAIPHRIQTVEELSLPSRVARFARFESGLAIVGGCVGSGRTTTLAALVDAINRTRDVHVITIENPIEFIHTDQRAIVHQREIGPHAKSVTQALRAAVHEDPDVLAISELEGGDAIRAALEAADRGILVLAVMCGASAASVLDRLLFAGGADDRPRIAAQLGEVLRGVAVQTLVPRVAGGQAVAVDLVFGSPAVAALIRDGQVERLDCSQGFAEVGGDDMSSMDASLADLVRAGVISGHDGLQRSRDRAFFRQRITLGGTQSPLG